MPTPQHETAIRFGCFFGTLLVMAVCELLAPRRPLTQSKPLRWFSNLGLAVLNNVVWRLLIPAGAIGLAISVQAHGWGLFNLVAWPVWFEVAASVVLFDLAIYAQHWIFHRVPWLWRLRLAHHVDLDFDATTGIRFHIVETLLSFVWKAVVIDAARPGDVGSDDLRDPVERDRFVQSRKRPPATVAGSSAALGAGDFRHAPRASLR